MENDYSGDAFIKFTDYLANKGLLKKPTASARKAAIVAFLEILDEDEKADVRGIDIDSLADRFANKKGEKFTPQSLVTYKSRYKSAYNDFISYKNNPLSFKPAISSRRGRKSSKTSNQNSASSNPTSSNQSPSFTASPQPSTDVSVRDIIFPIPIREGNVVKVTGLPMDLTVSEARKIADVVKALASDEIFE